MARKFTESDKLNEIIEILKWWVAAEVFSGFGFHDDTGLFVHWEPGYDRNAILPQPPGDGVNLLVSELRELLSRPEPLDQTAEFEVFEGELRPGSGLVRMERGQPYGFRGCVGLFLHRAEDSADRFLLTAGHLLSEDWKEGDNSEVFRSGSGSSGSGRRRKVGRVTELAQVDEAPHWNRVDAAIVQLDHGVEIDPETTCYDELGDVASSFEGCVLKCGNEEPIFTKGRIVASRFWFAIRRKVGGENKRYLFEDQLLVESSPRFPRPFARPGDSGCAVINAKGRAVYGLILGGSVLRDRFIVNRIDHLKNFYEGLGLKYRPAAQTSSSRQPANLLPELDDSFETRNEARGRLL